MKKHQLLNIRPLLCSLALGAFWLGPGQPAAFAGEVLPLTDVRPDHWAYQVLLQLSEKYQLQLGYPDSTFRGEQALTRYEVAALLLQVLQALERKQAVLTQADQEWLQQLRARYQEELEPLQLKLEAVEDQVDSQEVLADQVIERLNDLSDALPFRVFGSVALRSCLMSTNVFTEPQNILRNAQGSTFQVRLGAGIMGRLADHFSYQLRVLTADNNSYNLSWFPYMQPGVALRSPLNLDRFFIAWTPPLPVPEAHLALTVGKALNFLPETELLFDEDVSFTGLSQQMTWEDLTPWWPELSVGAVENIVFMDNPFMRTFLLGAKAASTFEPVSGLRVRLGGSYLHYLGESHLLSQPFLLQGYMGDTGQRNTAAGVPFQLVNAFLKVRHDLFGVLPAELRGDFVQNLGTSSQNRGWLAGVSLGELRQPGDWAFRYDFKLLEQDYQISLFAQEQMGGTDVYGHEFNLGVQVAAKTSAGLTLQTRNSLSRPEAATLFILYTGVRQDF